MGMGVMIIGASGSGKTSSLRNFSPDEIGVINVASKPLPFRAKLPTINTADYNKITATLKKNSKKCYVIDDAQYLMAFEQFSKVKETGYGKFTQMALNYYNLLKTIREETSEDTIVYILQHTEQDENGVIKAKTLGKMLDNQLTVEGLFSIVLLAQTDGKRHYFITQSDGYTTAKSPFEMFPLEIENDLKQVDTTIRTYYDLKG